MSDRDYDLGYFEGIRNAFRQYAVCQSAEDLEIFKEWILAELKDAKELMEEHE